MSRKRKLSEEPDQDDFWQAQAGVQVGSITDLRDANKRDAEKVVEPEFPIGFDIRPGKNIRPKPHETWGPDPVVI